MSRLVEDRALLDKFRRGDPCALEEVFREYVRPLFRLIRGGLGFENDGRHRNLKGNAEDILQETFRRAFEPKNRQGYDGIRPFLGYLCTIARNLMVDSHRTGRREPLRADESRLDTTANERCFDEAGEAPSPEDIMQQAEVSSVLKDFLAQLEPLDKNVYEVRFRQHQSILETARLLGLSEHRVKTSEQSLKRRFFFAMRKNGFFDGYRINKVGILVSPPSKSRPAPGEGADDSAGIPVRE